MTNWMERIVKSFRSAKKGKPPIIMTPYGAVTESARHQAALNMLADPSTKRAVIALLAEKNFNGDMVAAEKEARRRYPEAFLVETKS